MQASTAGNENTAVGLTALLNNTTGSDNIAIGFQAGTNVTTGNFEIDIGNPGAANESNTIRIGSVNQTATYVAGINGVDKSSGNPVLLLRFTPIASHHVVARPCIFDP